MKNKILSAALAWWQTARPRDKMAVKILAGILCAAVLFQLGIRVLVLGTIHKKQQVRMLASEVNAQSMILRTIPLEVQKIAQQFKNLHITQRNLDNPTPLLIYHLGEEQDRLGYTILSIAMPNAVQTHTSATPSKPASPTTSSLPPDVPNTAAAAATKNKFNMVVVEVSMRATYEQIGRLLSSLDALPIIVNVKHFSIKKDARGLASEVAIIFNVAKRRHT